MNQNKLKAQNKMLEMNENISMITINANRLNCGIKRQKLSGKLFICCLTKTQT